jgi:hypothetical protein
VQRVRPGVVARRRVSGVPVSEVTVSKVNWGAGGVNRAAADARPKAAPGAGGMCCPSYDILIDRYFVGSDRCDEPVAAFGHRIDVADAVDALSERLSQRGDVLSEVVLFDETIWPHTFDQFVFGDDMPAKLDEDEQRVEGFGGEGDDVALCGQQAVVCVQLERTEAVSLPGSKDLPAGPG